MLFPEVDARNPNRRRVVARDHSMMYGQRPKDNDVWFLSPYEFCMGWSLRLARYPLHWDYEEEDYHAALTIIGVAKLQAKPRGEPVELVAGTDYQVRDGGLDPVAGTRWMPFPNTPSTKAFRHTWVIVQRRRPTVPVFAGCPAPRTKDGEHERSAMLVLTYFDHGHYDLRITRHTYLSLGT